MCVSYICVCRCFSFFRCFDLVRVIIVAYKCNSDSDFVFLRYIFGYFWYFGILVFFVLYNLLLVSCLYAEKKHKYSYNNI